MQALWQLELSTSSAMFVFLILDLNIVKDEIFLICDPPYDFRDKGDNTLRTHFHLKTKEIDFNTLTKHTSAL